MIKIWQKSQKQKDPFLIIGEGSNVLFLEDFSGTVVLNQLKGIAVREEQDSWHLHVGAGERWHTLVSYTLKFNMPGLENLALIPGLVGAAPIQNIGAYGIDFQHFCEYVDVLNLETGEIDRMEKNRCQFSYRDSVFKHQFKTGYAIVGVGLRLEKHWKPVLNYGELTKLASNKLTPQQLFDHICTIRRNKLPDPNLLGNAGSFFKNPLVNTAQAEQLLHDYPTAPHYRQENQQVKLAAGWLIEQCALKGYRLGNAAVHNQQALVLVNTGDATSQDIIALAKHVRDTVAQKFSVELEPEVRFIGAHGERDPLEILS